MIEPAAPNFFIVGAAKSGTTAMHSYLRAHPDIFMSPVKAPSYFAKELAGRTTYSQSLDAYLALFRGGETHAVRGEASPAYLLDPSAAQRIRAFCDSARILILLRNPLESIVAVFGEARKYGLEPERDFAAALAASDRGRPRLVAKNGGCWTEYRKVVRYAEQVRRYQQAFPAEQLFIGLYDDLRADTSAVYGQVLHFLGVDSSYRPAFQRLNPYRGDVRSHLLQRAAMGRAVATGTDALGPRYFVRLRRRLVRWNVVERPRESLAPELRAELLADLRPDIERLSVAIGRDLGHWLAQPGATDSGIGDATSIDATIHRN